MPQILNIGASDAVSFAAHRAEYNQTLWDLQASFEEAYVYFVKAIRQLAYPEKSSTSHRGSSDDHPPAPSPPPIFVMRPLNGALEHATLNVVTRLRALGDPAIFWIDTSGWLSVAEDRSDPAHPSPGSSGTPPDAFYDAEERLRLTDLGNQRVAIFLHAHVCRYLARDAEGCAFLAPVTYEGKGYDLEEERLDEVVQRERAKRLRDWVWGESNAAT